MWTSTRKFDCVRLYTLFSQAVAVEEYPKNQILYIYTIIITYNIIYYIIYIYILYYIYIYISVPTLHIALHDKYRVWPLCALNLTTDSTLRSVLRFGQLHYATIESVLFLTSKDGIDLSWAHPWPLFLPTFRGSKSISFNVFAFGKFASDIWRLHVSYYCNWTSNFIDCVAIEVNQMTHWIL